MAPKTGGQKVDGDEPLQSQTDKVGRTPFQPVQNRAGVCDIKTTHHVRNGADTTSTGHERDKHLMFILTVS